MKTLRIILSITICLFLISCDKDDSINGEKQGSLSPPNWIIGTWGSEIYKVVFSKNNVIFTAHGSSTSTTINFKELDKDPTELIENVKTKNEYVFGTRTHLYGSWVDITYKFRKISSTQIEYMSDDIIRGVLYKK